MQRTVASLCCAPRGGVPHLDHGSVLPPDKGADVRQHTLRRKRLMRSNHGDADGVPERRKGGGRRRALVVQLGKDVLVAVPHQAQIQHVQHVRAERLR